MHTPLATLLNAVLFHADVPHPIHESKGLDYLDQSTNRNCMVEENDGKASQY